MATLVPQDGELSSVIALGRVRMDLFFEGSDHCLAATSPITKGSFT
jgi:hypothetical protein